MGLILWHSFAYSTNQQDYFDNQIGNNPSFFSTGGPNNGPFCRYPGAQGTQGGIFNLPTTYSTLFAKFDYRIATLPPAGGQKVMFNVTEAGTPQIALYVTDTGRLRIYRNTTLLATSSAGALISSAVWKGIEIKIVINNTTGSVEVRLDGSSTPVAFDASLTNIDTQHTANAFADAIQFNTSESNPQGGHEADYANFVLRDDTWSGNVRVEYKKPNGAGTNTQWTPSTGSNFQTVDETTKDTSDYNKTSTVGQRDSFAMEDIPNPSVVYAVCPVFLADKQDAGAATLKHSVRTGGSDFDSSIAVSPSNGSQKYFKFAYETNPNTATQWTTTEVNGMEAGYKRES